ncbi:MAG: hypothetical protein ACFFG0_00865 [Candidatus Thorarchaeota archaeon]
MKIPCEDCLILPICKSTLEELEYINAWGFLYDKCKLVKNYYKKFYTLNSKSYLYTFLKKLRSVYGEKYFPN